VPESDEDSITVPFLLTSMKAAFGHELRFEILNYITHSPKGFNILQRKFDASSANLAFHLKKLSGGHVIHKKDGKYVTTKYGKQLLNHFYILFNELLQKSKKVKE